MIGERNEKKKFLNDFLILYIYLTLVMITKDFHSQKALNEKESFDILWGALVNTISQEHYKDPD